MHIAPVTTENTADAWPVIFRTAQHELISELIMR